MRFFHLVGIALGAIALLNLIHIVVEFSMRDQVYACSDIGKYVPLEVKNKCRKYK
jgi:hypothetical protein